MDAKHELHPSPRPTRLTRSGEPPAPRLPGTPTTPFQSCSRCNGAHDPALCPHKTAQCNFCSVRGHVAKACRKRREQFAHQPQQGKGPTATTDPASPASPPQKCTRCSFNHDAKECPHKLSQCDYCNLIGHIAKACRRRRQDQKGVTQHPKVVVNSSGSSSPCTRCPGSHDPRACPHKASVCDFCQVRGHLAQVCWRRKEGAGAPISASSSPSQPPLKSCHRCDGDHDPRACQFYSAQCEHCGTHGHTAQACWRRKEEESKAKLGGAPGGDEVEGGARTSPAVDSAASAASGKEGKKGKETAISVSAEVSMKKVAASFQWTRKK